MLGVRGILTGRAYVRLGIPGPDAGGPENSGEWYHAVDQLPETRIKGWFGATIGGPLADDDVQVFLYDDNHLDPKVKLVMKQDDLHRFWLALGKMLEERFGLVTMQRPNGP